MGIEILDPEYNNMCGICFPLNSTPLTVYAIFGGIQRRPGLPGAPIPSAPNGVFALEQVPGIACYWRYRGGTWQVDYHMWRPGAPPNTSELGIMSIGGPMREPFWGADANQCVYKLGNLFVEEDGLGYWGGFGWVFAP